MSAVPTGPVDHKTLFDAADRGELSGYPGWHKPRVFWKPNPSTQKEVAGAAYAMLRAGRLAWEPLWREGADPAAVYALEPTQAGREWRQRCAERDQRRAALRAARSER